MKFTAVGDMIVGRRIPEDYEGYEELRPLIMEGDARFFNLETTLNRVGECAASLAWRRPLSLWKNSCPFASHTARALRKMRTEAIS